MTLHHTVPGSAAGSRDGSDGWLAVVRGDSALLVRIGPAGSVSSAGAAATFGVDELYAAAGGEDPVRATVELLTSRGFASTPDFGLVVRSSTGPLHVVVRGPVEVRLPDGVVSGAEVSTWTERVVAVGDYEMRAPVGTGPEGEGGAAEGAGLPLADGAAWAIGLRTAGIAGPSGAADAAGTAREEDPAGAAGAGPGDAEANDEARPVLPDDTVSDETIVGAAEAAAAAEDSGVVEETVLTAAEPSAETPVPETPSPAAIPEDTVVPEETVVRPSHDEEDERAGDDPAGGDPAGGELFDEPDEATVVRPTDLPPSSPATVPLPSAPASTFSSPSEEPDLGAGDHDGMTVLSSDVEGLARRERPTDDEVARPESGPGYVVVLPDGTREPLDGELLVGRSPSGRVTGGSTPRLVTLAGDPDLSRTHVRIALEGDTVVVTDLHSRNGTTLQLVGKAPQLLRAGEPATVIPGTVVDLGGGTVLTIEASG